MGNVVYRAQHSYLLAGTNIGVWQSVGSAWQGSNSIRPCSTSREISILRASNISAFCSSHPVVVNSRKLSSSAGLLNAKRPAVSPKDEGYVTIYKFKHIVLARSLCRLKIYQTIIAVLSGPLYCAKFHDNFDVVELCYVLGLGGFATLMLYVMGELFRRFVGFVYFHPVNRTVRISHLSFWGSRHDEIVPLEDVVALRDIESNFSELYVNMRIYSDPKKVFWLNFTYGDVVDKEVFIKVFGKL